MSFTIRYHPEVVSFDIPELPKRERERIRKAVQEKLTTQPEVFGKPLRRSLRGYRKLRVGDYRVIFNIDGGDVEIFAIGHRSKIYVDFMKRFL